MTKEQEIVRSVFDAYIRDAKATSTKKDRPTFDMLEKVKNRVIKALEIVEEVKQIVDEWNDKITEPEEDYVYLIHITELFE